MHQIFRSDRLNTTEAILQFMEDLPSGSDVSSDEEDDDSDDDYRAKIRDRGEEPAPIRTEAGLFRYRQTD
jgi:hypothetical protein